MRACRIAFAILLVPSGCCLSTISGDAGFSQQSSSAGSGSSTGAAGTSNAGTTGASATGGSGSSSGTSGGTSSGTGGEARTCLIDGQIVAAGAWLDTFYGSCTFCDPVANPNDWTELDAGSPCHNFAPAIDFSGPASTPLAGSCLKLSGLRSLCTCGIFGGGCPAPMSLACCGGFCGDGGSCVITQNLGWPTACSLDPEIANPCAQGPCCADAGKIGGVEMGWCCDLVDGGEKTCLGAGNVCFDDSNCCAGLSCHSAEAIFDGGESYGVCG